MRSQVFFLIKAGIEKWCFFATSLFLVGYFIFPTVKQHNLFLITGVSVPLVLMAPYFYKEIWLKNWVAISGLVLAFYLFINSLWSASYSLAQSLVYLRYMFFVWCLFGSIAFVQLKQPKYSEYLFRAFIIVGAVHFAYGIWEHFHIHPKALDVRYGKRPIDEATFAGMLLLACLWLMIESRQLLHKVVIFLLSIPFIIILLIAKSRGPQLALLVSIPLVAYFQGIKLRDFMLAVIFLLSILILTLLLTGAAKHIFSRGLEFPYRIGIWRASIQQGMSYFWFGQGLSENAPLFIDDGKFTHSHNIILSIFRMGGILGALLFIANFMLCMIAGFKQQSSIHKLWVVWLCFGLLCLMTNGRYPLTRHSEIWFAYWIPIAFIAATTPYFKLKRFSNSIQEA
jgi:hypothetical protein